MVVIQSSRLDFEVVVPMVGEFVLVAMGKLALKLAAEAAGRVRKVGVEFDVSVNVRSMEIADSNK